MSSTNKPWHKYALWPWVSTGAFADGARPKGAHHHIQYGRTVHGAATLPSAVLAPTGQITRAGSATTAARRSDRNHADRRERRPEVQPRGDAAVRVQHVQKNKRITHGSDPN